MTRALVLSAVTCLCFTASSHATAPITWSAPANISGDTDVLTAGTLVYARNFSQTQLSPTVNGVFFDIFPIPSGSTGAAGIPGVATLAYTNSESSDTAYGSSSAPFTSLSAPYRSLLSSGAGSSIGATLTLTLFNLNNGTPYVFQWWTNDSGASFGGLNSTTASSTNSVTLDENVTDTIGGMGQWATGTFIASGTTQSITFSGNRPEINAFQLREVPAPGFAALLGLGGLFASRRRRN
jgi:MYXO-CTERM domain-containing protein